MDRDKGKHAWENHDLFSSHVTFWHYIPPAEIQLPSTQEKIISLYLKQKWEQVISRISLKKKKVNISKWIGSQRDYICVCVIFFVAGFILILGCITYQIWSFHEQAMLALLLIEQTKSVLKDS